MSDSIDVPLPTVCDYTFVLNGVEVTVTAEPRASVLDVLREPGDGRAPVLTMKAGCSPQGLCGCCTALVDGKPRLTCTLPVKSLAGKSVTTLESVDGVVRDALAAAFAAEGGAQCGYCTPGIALSASVLLAPGPGQNLSPTDDDIHRALAPHLCRCTGYTGIFDSVRLAAATLRGDCTIAACSRPEARELVLGERPFIDDLVRPDAVYAVLVWAPGAVGRVEIAEVEGVIALRAAVEHASQPVAVVWGGTLARARAAARSAVVAFTATEAAKSTVAEPVLTAPVGPGVHLQAKVSIAASDPAYLEPEAVLVVPGLDADNLTLYTASQWPAAELAAVRAALPGTTVRSRVLPSGGSYGGKTSPIPAIAACRVALRTGRAVRLSLDLEEGMRLHPRRSAGTASASVTGTPAGELLVVRSSPQAGIAAAYGACSQLHEPVRGVRGEGVVLGALAVERALDGFARATTQDAFALRQRAAKPDGAALLDALADIWADRAAGAQGVALAAGGTGFGRPRVCLTVTSGSEIEVMCNVPELGQGRDAALVRILARESSLPADVYTVVWGDPDVTGDDAWGPVEAAAVWAAQALRQVGGRLGDAVGITVVGEADQAPAGTAAAVVRLGEGGAIADVHVAVLCGVDQDPLDVRRVAEGAAHMGVGVALSEEVADVDSEHGPMPETRFRMLGVLKSKVSPKIYARVVPAGAGEAWDCADAVVAATAAAVASAVSAFEGTARSRLPMKDSAAARGVGVRLRPPVVAPG